VLVSHGDQGTGYLLAVEAGVLKFAVNAAGSMTILECGAVPQGDVAIQVDVGCPELDRWDVEVTVDAAVQCRREGLWMRTGLMTPLHGIDVGVSRGSPVWWDLWIRRGSFPWSGVLDSVRYVPGAYAVDAPQLRVEEFRSRGMAVPGAGRSLPGQD
jgi:arylsulfatase